MRFFSVLLLLVALQGFAQQPPALPPIQPGNARPAEVLGGLAGPGFAIAYGEKDATLVAACEQNQLHYWLKPTTVGVRSGDKSPHVLNAHQGPVTALAWDGGPLLASAGTDRRIVLTAMPEAKQHAVLDGHAGFVRALALANQGKLLASGGDDKDVYLWELPTGKLLRKLEGPKDWVLSLACSPNGNYLAAGGYDGTIRVWNLGGTDKIPLIIIQPPPAEQPYHALALTFSADSKLLAAGGTDGQVRILDSATGVQARAMQGHTSSVTGLAFHPTGSVLASASKDRTVRLWNPANGQAFKVLEGHQAWVTGVVFVDRGQRLASVSADQTVRLWELR